MGLDRVGIRWTRRSSPIVEWDWTGVGTRWTRKSSPMVGRGWTGVGTGWSRKSSPMVGRGCTGVGTRWTRRSSPMVWWDWAGVGIGWTRRSWPMVLMIRWRKKFSVHSIYATNLKNFARIWPPNRNSITLVKLCGCSKMIHWNIQWKG